MLNFNCKEFLEEFEILGHMYRIVLGIKLFYMMGIWLGNMFGIRLKRLLINLHGKRQGTFVYSTYI